MSKKRFLGVLTIAAVLLLLCGCSAKSTTETVYISLDTPFSDAVAEGLFTAILTYPLAQAINYLSQYIGVGFGIAVVAITLNAVILALTFRSNVAMQKMQQLQPEIQKIQSKYEGRNDATSRTRMNAEMQQVYAKNNINPTSSLLASFIQLPILISMYTAVRRSYAVANGTFFGANLSMHPMEAIKTFTIPLIIVYVVMVISQFVSMAFPRYLQQRKAKKEADLHHRHYEKVEDPNQMMTYTMVVFIAFIMLNWPTALALYYCIYSLINIAKTLLIEVVVKK